MLIVIIVGVIYAIVMPSIAAAELEKRAKKMREQCVCEEEPVPEPMPWQAIGNMIPGVGAAVAATGEATERALSFIDIGGGLNRFTHLSTFQNLPESNTRGSNEGQSQKNSTDVLKAIAAHRAMGLH